MIKIIPYDDSYKEGVICLILNIWENEFNYKGLERPDIYNIPEFYQKDKNSNFWVALDDNKLVGTVGLINKDIGVANLKRMAVKKEFRNKGLGERLFEIVKKFAKEKGIKTIYAGMVPENVNAIKFYKKQGFIKNESIPEGLVISDNPVCLRLDL